MDEVTRFQILQRLAAAHDERQRGKIIQRLLELAFCRIGYRLVDERLSEGTDFDIISRGDPDERYSLEVRTTVGFTVPVKPEDLRLMDERGQDGYQTGLAALRIAAGGEWILVERQWLLPPSVRLALGSSPTWSELAVRINRAFNEILASHGERAVTGGLDALAIEVERAQRSGQGRDG